MGSDADEVRRHVDRAKGGDLDSWEWLYRRAYPRVFAYARRRVGSDAQADDVVSETMTRAIEKMAGFRWSGAGFDGWIFGICRNIVLETYRAEARATVADLGPLLIEERDPSHDISDQSDREDLLAAFGRLGPDERELLELRVVAELSSESVGAILGKSPAAVRMAQTRALSRLRTFWKEGSREH